MELSQNKNLNSKFYKVFLFLFSLTFITWWSGIAGASLYAVPSLLLVGFSIYTIIKEQYFEIISQLYNNFKEWISSQKNNSYFVYYTIFSMVFICNFKILFI